MSKKIKKFLVTGGTGFVGANICHLLINLGHQVTIFDNNSRGNLKRILPIKKELKFIKGDIRNYFQFDKALKNIDALIHLAYINGTKYFYSKPVDVLDVAIKGILNTFEGCKKHKIKELYIASSSEVYQTPNKIPTDENEPLKIPDIFNPRYSYGGGKILSELMGIHYGKKFFKKLIIFRPHNVYGPDMGNEHVIPEFINRLKKINKKNKKFIIQGSGKEIRSFIFIDDFIQAFELLIKKGKHLNIYNIGTEEKISTKILALKIAKLRNKKIVLKYKSLPKGSTKIRCPNITKIKKLGFKQKYNLDSGIYKIIKRN
tara:strand:- start:1212 stop:2159 length:948 start_codon:yes stop_codon:yes gene_type:complete